jgi:hypothetical protein
MIQLHNSLDKRIFEVRDHGPGNPAPGAGLVWTNQVNQRVEFLAVQFCYTADANVQDRLVMVSVYRGGSNVPKALAKGIHTANEVCQYYFSVGIAGEDEITTHQIQAAALPTDLILGPGDTLSVIASGMQAGDTIASIRFRLKRWITE